MSRAGRMLPHGRGGRYNNAAYANMHNGPAPHSHQARDDRSFVRPARNMPPRRRKILGENTYRILIKESKVKVVLGPEGRHIKEIRNRCSEPCKITIYTQHANGEPFPAESPDRILNLECSQVDLENVLNELIPHLQVAAPELMMDKFNEIRLVVPEFVCSMIIGKQGVNVKNIQKDLRSFVQVHKDPLPESSEFVVSLTNKDVTCLAASVNRIYESIQSIKSISPVTMFNPIVWYPGDFGDTGSYIEDINVRPHGHGQVQQAPAHPEHEEPRYYREQPRYHDEGRSQPRYHDEGRSQRSGYNRNNDYEDHERSNRHYNGRARGRNRGGGQNFRGRGFNHRGFNHRGGRQNGNSYNGQERQNVQYRADPENEHLSRNTEERDDYYTEEPVMPRRPKSFNGRG